MPTYFHKPENALKRANEFIKVGEKESALEVLNDVLRSRKHRGKWTETHQQIMIQFTQLCIDLHRSSFAKDGLYQYRTICKETNPASFEFVVKEFLKNAEKKASDAREESEQAVLQDVEDLDNDITPESLLLSTVSGEGAKERSDRVLLTPWVKFLWESYRNMLELLKNNNTVQIVYAAVAKDAFKFCLNFQRRTEFRKLCDTLHNHLTQAQKYQNQPFSLKFDQPDTIQCLVDVRFEQLESSIKIDLWQEAFRAIEEIHNLIGTSGKTPKPALLENFYLKQAKVYWMANNELFHAAALHRLFVLRKEQKRTFTADEAQQTASQVLLSTLCIPIEPVPLKTDRFLEVDDNTLDKTRRLSALLRMTTPPTRASLFRELIGYGVVDHASFEVRQLYNFLEVEFDPLLLSQRVVPLLKGLRENEELGQYVDCLEEITLVRLIKQVSQVYDSIELERLAELAPFTTITHLEKVAVETARTNNIPVRIDHKNKCLSFGQEMSFSHKEEAPEGPFVQAMPSVVLCSQLTMMSEALQQAVQIISQKDLEKQQLDLTRKTNLEYTGHFRADHRQMINRKQLIEYRKEFIESTDRAKKYEEMSEKKRREKQERAAESQRLEREAREREEQRKKAEFKEIKLKQNQDKLENLKKTAVGARALAGIKPEDLESMDAETIFSKQLMQMEKEKKEKEGKLRAQEKKVDYFERAKRLVEIPLIKSWFEEQSVKDKQYHDEQQEAAIAKAIAEREEAEEVSSRLSGMREDEGKFRAELLQKREKVLEGKLAEFNKKLDEVRAKRLLKRKIERRERRRAEAAETAKAEADKAARLKAQQEKEELEKERKERDELLEAQRQKQMQREQEIEEKQRKKEEEERQATENRLDARPSAQDRDHDESWRQKSPDRSQDSRYPPRHEEEPRRGYRPPAMRNADRDAGSSWRSQDERQDRDFERGPRRDYPRSKDSYDGPRRDFDRARDSYDSPRGGRRFDDPDRRSDRRGPSDESPWRRGDDRKEDQGDGGEWRSRDRRRDRDYEDSRGYSRGDGPRNYRDGPRDYNRGDRDGPRDYNRGARDGPRDYNRGDRDGPRDYNRGERDGPRDYNRGDRDGPRDYNRGDRDGPRNYRDGPRDYNRGDGYGRSDGPRGYSRSDGPRSFGRGDGSRDFGRGGEGKDWRGDGQDRSPRNAERRRDRSPGVYDKAERSPVRRVDDEGFEVVSRKR